MSPNPLAHRLGVGIASNRAKQFEAMRTGRGKLCQATIYVVRSANFDLTYVFGDGEVNALVKHTGGP